MIRMATIDDLPELGRFHNESIKHTYLGIFSDKYFEELSDESRTRDFERNIELEPCRILVSITEENVINGFVQFWLQDFKLRRGYLNNLHVDIKYKKQGIGSALLKASAEIMISEGIDEMFLFCEEHNTQARMFYDHLGFKFCGLDWDDGDDRLYPNCKLKIKNNILSPEIKPLNRTYKEMLMKVITDRFCLFGAGIYGNHFFSIFGDRYLPEYIFDTNPLKIGQTINGIPIIEPCQTELPILVTSMYYSEIKKRLKGMCSSKIIPFHPWVY